MSPHREEELLFLGLGWFLFFFLQSKKNAVVNNLIPTDANSRMTRLRAGLESFCTCFCKAQRSISIKHCLLHACIPSF